MDYEAQMAYSNGRNAFMRHNRMKVVSVGPGTSTVEAEISGDSLNPKGTVHGGVYFTLADCAVSSAARSDGRFYSTLSVSFEYLRAAKEGPLTCTASVIKRGETVSVFRAEIHGPDQRLLAFGTFTMYCIEK
ncbi:MAG: PaaI family thioesterase [Oscillospiraceae bacterium]|nr:PaaI family thioesterase [Oscillospiraceae bacterium]